MLHLLIKGETETMKTLKYKYPRIVITNCNAMFGEYFVGSRDFHNPDEVYTFVNQIRCVPGLKVQICDVCHHNTYITNKVSDYIYRKFHIDYHKNSDNFSMVLCDDESEPEFNGFVNTLPQALDYIDQYWFEKVKEKKNGK